MHRPTCTSEVDQNAIAYEEALRLETSIQALTPDAVYDDLELSAVLARTLMKLDPIEERILRMISGIGLRTEFTIREVAMTLELPLEETREMAKRAMRKILHRSRSRRLRAWLSEHQTGAPRLFAPPRRGRRS